MLVQDVLISYKTVHYKPEETSEATEMREYFIKNL
jgi:hypothetical protein